MVIDLLVRCVKKIAHCPKIDVFGKGASKEAAIKNIKNEIAILLKQVRKFSNS